jgi:uncharacterized protein (TIGR00266 family)
MHNKWYLSYGQDSVGPLTLAAARARAADDPNGHAWRDGFVSWQPIAHVVELLDEPEGVGPPAGLDARGPGGADQVEYFIHGDDMQYVEIELDPGESAVAEAGAMMYKPADVRMDTVFGDGTQADSAWMGKLAGAGRRLLTGERLFMTVFTHTGRGKARVAFSAPFPGTIIPVSLAELGGTLICQKDSFLCAARGVGISLHFQRRVLTGLFGGEGFIMQKLEGDGLAFVHAGGAVTEKRLARGEVLHVDTGCLVAMEASVDFDLEQVGGIKSALFGGEGLFFARLRGPGRVWLQSLPFSRLAGRMLAAAPAADVRAKARC